MANAHPSNIVGRLPILVTNSNGKPACQKKFARPDEYGQLAKSQKAVKPIDQRTKTCRRIANAPSRYLRVRNADAPAVASAWCVRAALDAPYKLESKRRIGILLL